MADSTGFVPEKGGLGMTGFNRANALENWFDTNRQELQRMYTSTDHMRNDILICHLKWQVSHRRKGVGAKAPDEQVTTDLSGI
jgi:hypothetical protein